MELFYKQPTTGGLKKRVVEVENDPEGLFEVEDLVTLAPPDDSWVQIDQEEYESLLAGVHQSWVDARVEDVQRTLNDALKIFVSALPTAGPVAALLLARQVNRDFEPPDILPDLDDILDLPGIGDGLGGLLGGN